MARPGEAKMRGEGVEQGAVALGEVAFDPIETQTGDRIGIHNDGQGEEVAQAQAAQAVLIVSASQPGLTVDDIADAAGVGVAGALIIFDQRVVVGMMFVIVDLFLRVGINRQHPINQPLLPAVQHVHHAKIGRNEAIKTGGDRGNEVRVGRGGVHFVDGVKQPARQMMNGRGPAIDWNWGGHWVV